MLEHYLAYFQYTNIKRKKGIETTEDIYHGVGCWPTSRLKWVQHGNPVLQHTWSPSWERVPSTASALWVKLQKFGVPGCNLRMQTDNIINLWANCSSCFIIMLFALSCKTWVLSLGLGWPNPLQGLNSPKICPLSYLWCCKACTHSRKPGHSQHSFQAGPLGSWLLLVNHKLIFRLIIYAFLSRTSALVQ